MVVRLLKAVPWQIKLAAIVVIALVIVVGAKAIQQRNEDAALRVQNRMSAYCTDLNGSYNTDCYRQAYITLMHDDIREKVIACDAYAPSLEKPFRDCLEAEHIRP